MRIGRTLPPAASPLFLQDLAVGLSGAIRGRLEVQRFTREMQAFFGVPHCLLVSSGKAALTLILQALHQLHPERDGVLIPAFTCYSVPSAIVRAGLRVSLCDIDAITLDFDRRQLQEKLADPRLLCVVPVHLFGAPADIDGLRSLMSDPAVTIVEDAAQAMGGDDQGRKLGTQGDVGFFSLGRGKALSAVEGGVILTANDAIARALAERYAALDDYSLPQQLVLALYALALWLLNRPTLFWLPKSLPFLRLGETIFDPDFPLRKLTGLQAGLTRRWQQKLQLFQQVRRDSVEGWKDALPSGGDVRGACPPLLRFPVLFDRSEQAQSVVEAGNRLGLGIAFAYPDSVHRVPELAAQFAGEDYPVAAHAARHLVTLPVHGMVRAADRAKILRVFHSMQKPQGICLEAEEVQR